MKVNGAFVSVFLLLVLVPVTTMIFNVWHCASWHHELACERQLVFLEKNRLSAVMDGVLEQLKMNHDVVWADLEQLKEPLVLPCELCYHNNQNDLPSFLYEVVLDRPHYCSERQLRLSVSAAESKKERGGRDRSISCLVSRDRFFTKDQKERYVFSISYVTFSASF